MLQSLLIIDLDTKRRAQIAHSLFNEGIFAEPFDSVGSCNRRWSSDATFLIYDEGNQLELLFEEFRNTFSWHPVIAYSDIIEPAKIVAAVRHGTCDYLKWPFTTHKLISRAKDVAEIQFSLCKLREREMRALEKVKHLSRREHDVLVSLTSGLPNKIIARELGISPRTVEIHRANMMRKLNATHVADAVQVAFDAGIGTGGLKAA